jgi:hypothetical protein
MARLLHLEEFDEAFGKLLGRLRRRRAVKETRD